MPIDDERSYRILIVEDNRVDRELYKRALQESAVVRFQFAESVTAAAAVEMSRKCRPDCVILDYNLPDMDGMELLARFKDESGRLACPVVMLTAYGGEELAVKAMKAGAMDYLPKGQVSAGTLEHIIVNAIDRFQMQKRIEDQRSALDESRRRYQALLDAIPQIVWTAAGDGRLQYANRQWFDYTGLSLDQADRLGWDTLLHPEDYDRSWSAWEQAVKSGSIFEIEHRIRRAADGTYRWHLVRAVPMFAAAEAPPIWFGTCTEIENQKRMERAIREKQKIEGIGTLAGGVAHDFNNLLMVIVGYASLALEGLPPSHPVREKLESVVTASEQASQLTRKMLLYAGKGHLDVQLTDIDRVVQETLQFLKDSIPPEIRVIYEANPDVLPIKTDPGQLRQVIIDLVVNAAEAIGEEVPGTITIRTLLVEVDSGSAERSESMPAEIAPGKYVALEVEDTGCGMNEETQRKIFDPFFSTKFTGRGLGLAAVQGFVRSNRGSVSLESQPGKGTKFRVLLPVVQESRRIAR